MSKATLSTTSPSAKAEVDVASSQRIHIISSSSNSAATLPQSQCEPWNLQQFLDRVATFSSLSWHIQRTDVTPLRCARFGWKCIHTNRLQCTGCGTKLEYQTNATWSRDINDKYAQTFLENIRRTHTSECIWKTTPCDASFELLPRDHAVLQQQLLFNLSSWTQPNGDGVFTVPTLDPRAKQLMTMQLKHKFSDTAESDSSNSWLRHPLCLSVMLLSGCGWRLSTNTVSNSAEQRCFVECRYCNKCVSLATYVCRTTHDLLPSDPSTSHTRNNSFMAAINEQNESDDENESDCEHKMEVVADEVDADTATTASILTEALPIHDADSVMRRLSRLGLKIESTRQHNRHRFEIYETPSLQKQARFTDSNTALTSPSTPARVGRGFGAVTSSFGSYRAATSSAIRWPKMSVLTSPSRSAIAIEASPLHSAAQSHSRKRRKRSRGEMECDSDGEAMSDIGEGVPRKKMKTASKSSSLPPLGEERAVDETQSQRRSRRKRKLNESVEMDESVAAQHPQMKRRRIGGSERGSSVSTTVEMSPSVSRDSSVSNTNSNANSRRSRKRKLGDVMMGESDGDDEEDEDDDIVRETSVAKRAKRRRLDTPTVAGRLYLDPISAHAPHCPFVTQSVYARGRAREAGYVYALRLLPRDIAYIRQLAEQQKRAKCRF